MFRLLPPPLSRLSLAESSWRACQDRFRFETSDSASEPLRLLSERGELVGVPQSFRRMLQRGMAGLSTGSGWPQIFGNTLGNVWQPIVCIFISWLDVFEFVVIFG